MSAETSRRTVQRQEPVGHDKIINLTAHENKRNVLNDAAFAIQICRTFLKALGIWLPIDAGLFSWRTVIGSVSVIVCYFSIGIRSIPVGLYIIFDEKRPIEKLRLISRCVFAVMTGIKYTFLRSHRKNIGSCMKHIELDWLKLECTASRDIMLEHARFGHLITRICAAFTYSGAVFIYLLPIFWGNIPADKKHAINATVTAPARRFAVPSHFGLPVFSTTPIYEFIYSSQVIASFVLMSIAIACYSLAVVIVMHTCGQLKILIGKLGELVDGGGKMTTCDSVDGRMSDIIIHHICLFGRKNAAGNMPRRSWWLHLSTLLFGEWRSETKHPMAICTYVTILVTFVFNLFSFCYIVELLNDECMNVGEMAYMIDWHRLPGKQSLNLGLMIIMTHSPVTLTAGGSIQLSFRCFASVVKTAMGYLNMLRTVMD